MLSLLKTLFIFFCLMMPIFARAEWVVLPESKHQLFETFGLYIDEQSMILLRDSGRAWAAIGGSLGLLGNEELPLKPQLVIHGSANAAFQINQRGDTLLTQTVDARLGLAIDLQFDESFRGNVTWTHQSGHVADNVPDLDLFGSNLGNEIIDFRVVKDLQSKIRVGGGIRPTVGSDPGMIVFGEEQFVEYFPFEEGANPHEFKPYIACGFEEYGRGTIQFSSNFQIGYAAGSHFRKERHSSLRAVLGYYTGNDPRLKYYQFKHSRLGFAYAGLAFDL